MSHQTEVDKLIEDVELEFQLDGVGECFPACLNLIKTSILESEDSNVERDDNRIHGDKMIEEALRIWASEHSRAAHEYEGAIDVQPADDTLLKDKPRNLEYFPLLVDLEPISRFRQTGSSHKRSCSSLHDNAVRDDHV